MKRAITIQVMLWALLSCAAAAQEVPVAATLSGLDARGMPQVTVTNQYARGDLTGYTLVYQFADGKTLAGGFDSRINFRGELPVRPLLQGRPGR